MEYLSSSSTGSSQNQTSFSLQGQEPGSFQNQPPKKSRKHGIAALLADVTNQPKIQCCKSRLCKEETITKVSTAMVRDFEPGGDAVKGGKARSKILKNQASQSHDTCTLYSIYTKDNYLTREKSTLEISYLKMCIGRFRKPLQSR